MITSQNGASGAGFENVSGPPAITSGWWSSRSSRSGGMLASSRVSTTPAISSSYATECASIGYLPPGLERDELVVVGLVARQHRAIGRDVRHPVQRPIDLLVAERAHRRAIRARIHERDPRLRFLEQRAARGGQQHRAIHQ